jgi:hypothetical protein
MIMQSLLERRYCRVQLTQPRTASCVRWISMCLATCFVLSVIAALPAAGADDMPSGACQGVECTAEPRNLVLGTQKGLLTHEMRVFLASLRSVGCRAEVVIFSADKGGRQDLEEVAEVFDARLIEYDFDTLSARHGPMNLHRFRLFHDFLHEAEAESRIYGQVLMCDVRDVFFQTDPFEALAVADGIGVALEPAHLTIGACDIHARWLEHECGEYKAEQVLAKIADKSRSCAGTTIGTHNAIKAYCIIMQHEATRTVREVDAEHARAFEGRITTFDGHRWRAWCNDQAMHNAMLWTGRLEQHFNVTEYRAEDSALATVGTMKMIRTNAEGEVLTGCGEDAADECAEGGVAALVHQYDRIELLVRQVQALYALDGEIFQTFEQRWGGGAAASGGEGKEETTRS